ncbi:MAG: inorganic diphosphatase [Chloroflexota bacterium]
MQSVNSQSYLGQMVSITIDRPLGSRHPQHQFIYPLNYGFVPNTLSGDGEELDAYVLGVFEPLEGFNGRCIAIIHRLHDNDDKLVLVPSGKHYTNEQIKALTEFQERFFDTIILRPAAAQS